MAERLLDADDGLAAAAGFEVTLLDESEVRDLEQVLVDRIYEFNANATGCFDGLLIGGCVRTSAGDLVGGYSGHTWAGCCVITHLWVAEASRERGVGRQLLQSAEIEAVRRRCVNLIVATHDFQAPCFYERMGYAPVASIADWPTGHASTFYRKALLRKSEAGRTGPSNAPTKAAAETDATNGSESVESTRPL